jgi:hypothetical protein
MILLVIPVALVSLAGLLFLTESLERRSSDVMLRMAMRSSRTSPEATERLFATELAHRLELAGLARRPDRLVVPVDEGSVVHEPLLDEGSGAVPLVDLAVAVAPS